MSEVCQVKIHLLWKLQEKSLRRSKEKKCKICAIEGSQIFCYIFQEITCHKLLREVVLLLLEKVFHPQVKAKRKNHMNIKRCRFLFYCFILQMPVNTIKQRFQAFQFHRTYISDGKINVSRKIITFSEINRFSR